MKLSEGIEEYVTWKRSSGFGFEASELLFRAFLAGVGNLPLAEITTQTVKHYLDSQPSRTFAWRAKYRLLMHFFDFWAIRGIVAPLTMPPERPGVKRTFVPHIYSREQIRLLLKYTSKVRPRYKESLSPQTLRTIILFLYATGASVGESFALECRDIDVKRGLVTIHNRFRQQRTIPICRDLNFALQKYERWKAKHRVVCQSFFVKNDGTAVLGRAARDPFRMICRQVCIRRTDGSDPTLQDFRPTFAVHRIASWIRSDVDLNKMLPALAVYMGYANLCATEKYLPMTPERFRKDLNKLSLIHRKGRWGKNKSLMAFLETLAHRPTLVED